MFNKIHKILADNKVFFIGIIISGFIILLMLTHTKIPIVNHIGVQQKTVHLDLSIKETLSKDIPGFTLDSITCFMPGDRSDTYIGIIGYRTNNINGIIEVFLKNGEMYSLFFTSCKLVYQANASTIR